MLKQTRSTSCNSYDHFLCLATRTYNSATRHFAVGWTNTVLVSHMFVSYICSEIVRLASSLGRNFWRFTQDSFPKAMQRSSVNMFSGHSMQTIAARSTSRNSSWPSTSHQRGSPRRSYNGPSRCMILTGTERSSGVKWLK